MTIIYAINCGGGAVDGYNADDSNLVTTGNSRTYTGNKNDHIGVFGAERYGRNSDPLEYTFPVAAGDYIVTLSFAENFHATSGNRVFDVLLNGAIVVDDLDIVAEVGATGTYQYISPSPVQPDGAGNIVVRTESTIDSPKINGILIESAPSAVALPLITIPASGVPLALPEADLTGPEQIATSQISAKSYNSLEPGNTVARKQGNGVPLLGVFAGFGDDVYTNAAGQSYWGSSGELYRSSD